MKHGIPRPLKAVKSAPLKGQLRVPGDKSISHRALILGALAEGRTTVDGLLEAADVLHTAAAARAFGAKVVRSPEGRWEIVGAGGFKQPPETVRDWHKNPTGRFAGKDVTTETKVNFNIAK